MILELADIRIPPDKGAAFAAAIIRGVETVTSKARGFSRLQGQPRQRKP